MHEELNRSNRPTMPICQPWSTAEHCGLPPGLAALARREVFLDAETDAGQDITASGQPPAVTGTPFERCPGPRIKDRVLPDPVLHPPMKPSPGLDGAAYAAASGFLRTCAPDTPRWRRKADPDDLITREHAPFGADHGQPITVPADEYSDAN